MPGMEIFDFEEVDALDKQARQALPSSSSQSAGPQEAQEEKAEQEKQEKKEEAKEEVKAEEMEAVVTSRHPGTARSTPAPEADRSWANMTEERKSSVLLQTFLK